MSLADARTADSALAAVPTTLDSFRFLPKPEPGRRVRARMAEWISRRVSAEGNITFEELRRAGFSEPQIKQHFDAACRVARVTEMAI